MAVIGIDLGTTNSLACVYKDGKAQIIPNRFGSALTPSVVSVMEDGSIVVGQPAKERLLIHPECTAASFKKDMGTDKKRKLGNKEFLPEELSSFVLRAIVEDARAYLGEDIEEAVISVPAYFYDEQRQATKLAGTLAGIRVERIINEPSAAALDAYYGSNEEKTFLVVDLGGGTLDVSVVECFGTMVQVVSVAGNNHLGGDNFDVLMAQDFLKEHGLKAADCTRMEFNLLKRQAEKCKIALTLAKEAVMEADFRGQYYESVYTMQRLAQVSEELLKEIRRVIGHALKDGDIAASEIQDIVMVGGSAKMPLIQSYVRHLFKKTPQIALDCDLKVARGVGLVSGVKTRQAEIRDYILADICPFSLGTSIVNREELGNSYMSVIISRNTPLPCSRTCEYHTVIDYVTEMNFDIRQGEHPYAKENVLLGELKIRIPRAKAGQEKVALQFTYDINGILIVKARVLSTGEEKQIVLSKRVAGKELEKKVKELSALMVQPKDKPENKELMARLKKLYEEEGPEERKYVEQMIRTFEKLLARQNEHKIEKFRRETQDFLEKRKSEDVFGEINDFDWNPEDDWTDEKNEEDAFSDDFWNDEDDAKWTN